MPDSKGETRAEPCRVRISRRVRRQTVIARQWLIRLADVAELLAAELVSNAVRHTKGPAALRLCWRDGVLRIGAWDASPEPPPYELAVTPDAGAGRGLVLVRACADDWGWHPQRQGGDFGKYVWCDLEAA